MTQSPARIVLAALVAVALPACGGSGDDGTARTARGGSAATSELASDQGARPPTSDSTTGGADGTEPTKPSESDGTAVAPVDGSHPSTAPSTSMYAPPPGTYLYDTTGHTETTGPGGRTEPVPPTSTDQVSVAADSTSTRVTVTTRDEGRDSSQEVVVAVTATEARLVRLTYRPAAGVGYAVNPDPPAQLARLPYRDGDRWEIAWSDPSSGVSGAGTGALTGRETLTTSAGTFDTVVITVTQRLRGAIEGTLAVTSWIDPTTGIQVKQHLTTDLRDATGASRTDTTRTLRERRS